MSGPEQVAASLGVRALEVARAELSRGVREEPPGSNDGADVRRYLAPCVRAGRRLGIVRVPWCAAFASWCVWTAAESVGPFALQYVATWVAGDARQPHCPAPPIGYRASVAELIEDARATGAWRDLDAAEEPLPGDLACFGRDGQDPRLGGHGHVGHVESWGPDVYSVISGNDGDAVRRRVWYAGEPWPWEWAGWIKL